MYRVRTAMTGLGGAPYVSTMYFNEAVSTAQQAADAVAIFWGAADAFMVNTLTWAVEDTVVLVDPVTGQAQGAVGVSGGSGVGAAADAVLPRATQALVRWHTGQFVGGREVRGRTFVPGLTESSNTVGGLVIAAAQTGIQAAADALLAVPAATLVIYSPANQDDPQVDHASVWQEFAVLRSRRD